MFWVWAGAAWAADQESGLVVRKRVDPVYPKGATSEELGDVRCLVTVFVDEDGVPFDAQVDGCPTVFHDSARDALLQWRWFPPQVEGEPVKARTTIGITYRKEPEASAPAYFDGLSAVGVARSPSVTAGVFGGRILSSGEGLGLPEAVALGLSVELRLGGGLSHHSSLLAGWDGEWADRGEFAVLTGLGVDQQGTGADALLVARVPALISATWFPTDSLAVLTRGGVNLPFAAARTELPGPSPELGLGLGLGANRRHHDTGLRIEGGWHPELGQDVFTVVAGIGI